MWSAQRVRDEFIKFYKGKDHINVPSSSVVPQDDPSLLFANAGMNQFKSIFLGTVEGEFSTLKRAVNSQKCIRAGGKHNDLDDVGKDTYHHTFFEMLGTWSFNDYFKKESIDWAWQLLTQVYLLDPNRIYVTYFQGSPTVEPDTEARDLWSQYLPAERILPFGMKENFWEMGETGPCGPCSEIHYDLIGNRDASNLVNRDDPTVIEIWNHVFIQFNRDKNGLVELPCRHIDTGMGLERLTAILQGKSSNYDIDIFTPLFTKVQSLSQCSPYGGSFHSDIDMAYRVIVDHIRTLVFAIGDGAMPSNTLRGYIVRKILRRAVRYSKFLLPESYPTEGFLSQLVSTVVDIYSPIYGNLTSQLDIVKSTIQQEELSFLKTLNKGTRKFLQMTKTDKVLSGENAWKLSDTYGLPLDIIQLLSTEANIKVNLDEYEICRKHSIEISKSKN